MRERTNPEWYKEHFEEMEIEYKDHPFTQNTENEVKWKIKKYLTNPKMKILDVGCGTRHHTINLATKGYKNITATGKDGQKRYSNAVIAIIHSQS